ncbi:MAG TPA: RNA polymerase sigma factor, partial [Pyrinomonadaceae bacterium]
MREGTKSATDDDKDKKLVKQILDGSEAAFNEIYQNHYKAIYAICFRMTQSKDTAEDLTQDVFIKLYEKVKTFRGESAFATWLY